MINQSSTCPNHGSTCHKPISCKENQRKGEEGGVPQEGREGKGGRRRGGRGGREDDDEGQHYRKREMRKRRGENPSLFECNGALRKSLHHVRGTYACSVCGGKGARMAHNVTVREKERKQRERVEERKEGERKEEAQDDFEDTTRARD